MFGKGRAEPMTCDHKTKAYVDLPPLPQVPPLKTFVVTLPDGGTTRVKGHWYGDWQNDEAVRIYRQGPPNCLAVTVGTGGVNVEWVPVKPEIVATFAKWIAIEEVVTGEKAEK